MRASALRQPASDRSPVGRAAFRPLRQTRLRLVSPRGAADRFGLHHSAPASPAIEAFEEAVYGVAAHRATSGPALARALALEPGLVAAHALKGFGAVTLGRSELADPAREALAGARSALTRVGGGTADEIGLTEALAHAVDGKFLAAASRLESVLDSNPEAFLPVKLAYGLRFMMGDAAGMLATTSRVLDRFDAAQPGAGFVLGCHAFALEEFGHYQAAERIGRRAVEIEPADAWGLHAVGHVFEMQGRTDEGIAWLERARPIWRSCNNFSFHMAWHLALFHLERGEPEHALALYDTEVRPHPTDDFRDMANAVSLLWRLEQDGAVVGDRWEALREIAVRRKADTTLAFAALHNLLALVALGETKAAQELSQAMKAKADTGAGDQADVMATVACDLADVCLDLTAHGPGRGRLDRLAAALPAIGGSHAQRDIFVRVLTELAADRDDREFLEQLLALRRRLKREDRFATRLQVRLEALRTVRRRA